MAESRERPSLRVIKSDWLGGKTAHAESEKVISGVFQVQSSPSSHQV